MDVHARSGTTNRKMCFDMEEKTIKKAEKAGILTSLVIHATVFLLFVVLAGRSGGIQQDMITVVLDSSPLIMGSGEGGGKSGSTPEARVERTVKEARAKETKRPVKTSHRPDNVVSEARTERKTESAETESNNFSEVVSDTVLQAPRTSGGVSEGNSQAGSGWGKGPGTGGSGMGGIGGGRGIGFGNRDGAGDAIYIKKHFAFIRDMILKNLTYPAIARRMGWKGNLTVSFVICEGGSVENIRVVRSSGHKVLDENALSTIKAIQPFPKPPARAEIIIPIEYKLARGPNGTQG